MRVEHLIHSLDPRTGGVFSAVQKLSDALSELGVESVLNANPKEISRSPRTRLVAHGLWQWPGVQANQLYHSHKIPYVVYPHGMLDPWFKKTYPLKHIKKQLYWWWRQAKIMHDAKAVCFTTDEELQLARCTFFPYRCEQHVTGLGVNQPPCMNDVQMTEFFSRFPKLKNRRLLLYLGRFHPKKGLDDLLIAWKNRCKRGNEVLVFAGPLEEKIDGWKNFKPLLERIYLFTGQGCLKGT